MELYDGVAEIPGEKDNARILAYHSTTTLRATDDEVAWCSSFVNWCIQRAGINGTRSAAARSWMSWGERLDTPRLGALVVYRRPPSDWSGHVHFFVEQRGSWIYGLGGNQGNRVSIARYDAADVLGIRWPGVGK